MKLLLARHGNTFEAGVPAYIVGRNEDLPLTAEGEAQAARLAAFLKRENTLPGMIFCGSLSRTRRTAAIIADALALPAPVERDCLTEIDYGAWSGLTMGEIRARFGNAEAEAWETQTIMPPGRGWSPDAAALRAGLTRFADDIYARAPDGTILAITSNGILRFFAGMAEGLDDAAPVKSGMKVATGNICRLDRAKTGFTCAYWNRSPAA